MLLAAFLPFGVAALVSGEGLFGYVGPFDDRLLVLRFIAAGLLVAGAAWAPIAARS